MSVALDIFGARPDGSIWPIPGVYGAKARLQELGFSAVVHDSFLGLPPATIAQHLTTETRSRPSTASWGMVFISTELFPEGTPDHSPELLARVRAHIDAIRALAPATKWCVVAYIEAKKSDEVAEILSGVELILENGYEGFLDFPVKIGLIPSGNRPAYGLRKAADHKPAKGFVWRSVYQMLDMPNCIGVCANCFKGSPDYCSYMSESRRVSLDPLFAEVVDELQSLRQVFNILYVENPLTISPKKFGLFSEALATANFQDTVELHYEGNLLVFTSVPNWDDFLRRHRWGACHFTISASAAEGQFAMGFPAIDVIETVARIRRCVGPRCYLNITLLAGLPGDTFSSIEESVGQLHEVADCVNVYPVSIVRASRLAAYDGYRFDDTMLDRWSYANWSLKEISSKDVRAWCQKRHRNQLLNPAYRNYRHSQSVLFANNAGYASDQIRHDLTAAAAQPEPAFWLEKQITERRSALLSEYRALYE